MLKRFLENIFGEKTFDGARIAFGLKDFSDKVESYFGILCLVLAALIEWVLISIAARTAAPGAWAWMIPINVGLKAILGYSGLVWLVRGAWLLVNLWIFARRGKTAGIVPMALASLITYEYGNCVKFPWVAFIILLVAVIVFWVISLRLPKPVAAPATEDEEKAKRRWIRIRRVAILFTIALILVLVGQITSFGVKLLILVPLVLRVLDLIQKNN